MVKANKALDQVKKLFGHWLSQMVAMLKPQILCLILGRGSAKTTDIIARRAMDICYEMPGAYIAISSDTYMNALKNVLPSIIEGWERNGWIEGIHFVVSQRPHKGFYPTGYGPPYKPPLSWKHTITVFTGTHFKLISQDRPSTGAGDSYQHIIGDEMKYQVENKFNKLRPALRGEFVRFGHSPYYGGMTLTTDMPNPNHGEHDWFLRLEKNMDPEQIRAMAYAADMVNKEGKAMLTAERKGDDAAQSKAKKRMEKWEARLKHVRKGSTFFYIASSFVNLKMLRTDYFKNIFKTMKSSEVLTSILSISPKLEKGQMFYPNFNKKNIFDDSYVYEHIDKADSSREYSVNSLDLKHCDKTKPLIGGLDTGKMCSLVVGQQPNEKIIRILKGFHTLPPDFLNELGADFREFFKHHQNKVLKLYHDRAANAMQRVGEDHASKIKKAIEQDENGNDTGWRVQLMSREQGNITQETEFELMLQMCEPNNKAGLPMLMICRNEAAALKSSIQICKVIIKRNAKTGKKTIHKDKSSEKLPDDMLPFFSTNFSDAMKYFCCTPENLKLLEGQEILFSSSPGIH